MIKKKKAPSQSRQKKKRSKKEVNQLLNFFIQIGELKRIKRSGWVLRNVKNPETIAEHTFRMAIMAWLLAKRKRLNLEKVIKIALIHDLCEVYAGDTTPYDQIIFNNKSLLVNKKELKKIFETWPRFSQSVKKARYLEKYKKELRALNKLTAGLPAPLKQEIRNLWMDYEKGLTREGRFLRQVDRVENMLQAFEYRQKDKKLPIRAFYIQIKELVDDPVLLDFLTVIEKKFGKII